MRPQQIPVAHLPAIDSLRALAVSVVLIFHLNASFLPGGFVGVDVFFVISGYVVTGSLLRGGVPSSFVSFIAGFYARRFKRILPALLVCLLATVLASAIFIPDAWLSRAMQSTGLSAFFGFSNFLLAEAEGGYFNASSEFNPFTHTWSLAVEEQFYLVFPLLLYFLVSARGEKQVRVLKWLLGFSFAASLTASAWASREAPTAAYYMLYSRWWELACGVLLHFLPLTWRAVLVARIGCRILLLSGVALIILAVIFAEKNSFPIPWAVPAVIGTALAILAIAEHPSGASAFPWISRGPLVTIGLLSYSLYLWHWPVFSLMRWTVGLHTFALGAAALLLVVVLAWLSYRFVEVPTKRMSFVVRLPSVAVIVLGLVAVIGSWRFASEVYARPWYFNQTSPGNKPEDWYPLPASPERLRELKSAGLIDAKACGVAISEPAVGQRHFAPDRQCLPQARRLFVAGDSHAGAYDRLLSLVAATQGIAIHRFSKGGCPIGGLVVTLASQNVDCRAFHDATVLQLVKMAQPGDLVFLPSLRVPRLVDQNGIPEPPAERALNSPDAVAVVEIEFRALIKRLTDAGLQVVLEAPKPVMPAPPFRCVDWFNRLNPSCRGGLDVDLRLAIERRARAMQVIGGSLDISPLVSVWDPLPVLCDKILCKGVVAGRPIFFDGDHLSGYGNEVVATDFIRHVFGNDLR